MKREGLPIGGGKEGGVVVNSPRQQEERVLQRSFLLQERKNRHHYGKERGEEGSRSRGWGDIARGTSLYNRDSAGEEFQY